MKERLGRPKGGDGGVGGSVFVTAFDFDGVVSSYRRSLRGTSHGSSHGQEAREWKHARGKDREMVLKSYLSRIMVPASAGRQTGGTTASGKTMSLWSRVGKVVWASSARDLNGIPRMVRAFHGEAGSADGGTGSRGGDVILVVPVGTELAFHRHDVQDGRWRDGDDVWHALERDEDHARGMGRKHMRKSVYNGLRRMVNDAMHRIHLVEGGGAYDIAEVRDNNHARDHDHETEAGWNDRHGHECDMDDDTTHGDGSSSRQGRDNDMIRIDLQEPGQTVCIARGGRGGRGSSRQGLFFDVAKDVIGDIGREYATLRRAASLYDSDSDDPVGPDGHVVRELLEQCAPAGVGGRGSMGGQRRLERLLRVRQEHGQQMVDDYLLRRCAAHVGDRTIMRATIKSLADVGLVGFPSAGKSSLLRALTNATPHVAAYPFTTLRPQFGVMNVAGHEPDRSSAAGRRLSQGNTDGPVRRDVSVVVADVPGIIPGAHQGKGLGLHFLRHVERTRFLCLLIDPSHEAFGHDTRAETTDVAKDPVHQQLMDGADYVAPPADEAPRVDECVIARRVSSQITQLFKELVLYDDTFNPQERVCMVVLTKSDLLNADGAQAAQAAAQRTLTCLLGDEHAAQVAIVQSSVRASDAHDPAPTSHAKEGTHHGVADVFHGLSAILAKRTT